MRNGVRELNSRPLVWELINLPQQSGLGLLFLRSLPYTASHLPYFTVLAVEYFVFAPERDSKHGIFRPNRSACSKRQ